MPEEEELGIIVLGAKKLEDEVSGEENWGKKRRG